MPVTGWDEFSAAVDGVIAQADAAAHAVVIDGMSLVEWYAKRNFQGVRRRVKGPRGTHIEPPDHIGPKGSGMPNVISGNLRRSIRSVPAVHVGLGTWAGQVGPTAVYGRRVALQYGYDFLGPAVETVRPRLQGIAAKYWGDVLAKAGR